MRNIKKALSLLIAVSMIFALVVFPTTVNAALGNANGTVAISYRVLKGGSVVTGSNMLYPGDDYDVELYLTATEDNSPITAVAFCVAYDDSKMDFTAGSFTVDVDASSSETVSADGVIRHLSYGINDFDLAANTETKFATMSFKVKKTTPAGTYTVGSAAPSDDTIVMVDGSPLRKSNDNLTEAVSNVVVSKYPVNVMVGEFTNENISGKTIYSPDGVLVQIEDVAGLGGIDDSATMLTGPNGYSKSTSELLAGVTVKDGAVSGEYTVTVKADGWSEEVSYTFTLNLSSVDAVLNFDASGLVNPYKSGQTITVPVSLKNLTGGAEASMVTFNAIYDADKLELAVEGDNTSATPIAGQGTQVVYDGTASLSEATLGNDEVFATLKFTVKEDAAFGNTSISSGDIAGYEQKFVVAGAFVSTDAELGDADTIKAVIVPDDFAAVTSSRNSFVGANSAYDISVAPVEGAEARYGKGSINDGVNFGHVFDSATPITDNKFTVSEEKDYYVITRIGTDPAAYELDILRNGEGIFIDLTEPTLTVPAGTDGWMNSYTRELTAFTATDANGLDDSFGIQYSTNGSDWTPITGSNPMNIEDFEGNVTVKVKDIAGNEKTEMIAVQVDTTDPTVTLTDNGYVTGGKKAIAIAAADNNGNVKSGVQANARIFRSESPLADESFASIYELSESETITLTNGEYTHEVGLSGTYYVVVFDNAGNAGIGKLTIAVEEVTDTAALLVKTNYDDENYHEGFDSDDIVGSPWTHNGYYTYVDLKTAEVAGCTSSITVNGQPYTTGTGIATASSSSEAELVTVVVKTWLNGAEETNAATDTYKFYIAGEENMPSIDGDGRYNVLEIDRIRRVLLKSNKMPDANDGFEMGKFSGDMNGNLAYETEDIGQLVEAFRCFEFPGDYFSLDIMNYRHGN